MSMKGTILMLTADNTDNINRQLRTAFVQSTSKHMCK